MTTSDKFTIAFCLCNAMVFVLAGVCVDAGFASTGANLSSLSHLMGIISPLLLATTVMRLTQ